MSNTAKLLVAIVALAHLWLCLLDTALWTTPFARTALRMTAEQAEQNRILAFNQGAYTIPARLPDIAFPS